MRMPSWAVITGRAAAYVEETVLIAAHCNAKTPKRRDTSAKRFRNDPLWRMIARETRDIEKNAVGDAELIEKCWQMDVSLNSYTTWLETPHASKR